jgi:hypothetical protein
MIRWRDHCIKPPIEHQGVECNPMEAHRCYVTSSLLFWWQQPVLRRTHPAWIGTVNGPDGKPMDVTYIFEAMGETLFGTVSTKLGGGPFSEGKIEGKGISFVVRTDQFTINTTGTLSGDVINIAQKNGNDTAQFTIHRMK